MLRQISRRPTDIPIGRPQKQASRPRPLLFCLTDGLPIQARASPQRQGWPALQPQPHGEADNLAVAVWQPQVQTAPWQLVHWQLKFTSVAFMADPRLMVVRTICPWRYFPERHCRMLESNG